MKEMKTLTINGVTFTVADPDAAHIDDAAVSPDTTWSGKKISEETDTRLGRGVAAAMVATADKLCSAFSESGAAVTCQPVEGYPLQVVSQIVPAQEGSGDPSPENIRPITGHTAAGLTHGGGSGERGFVAELGQTVYGGSYDWTTGVLTVAWKLKTFTGSESWKYYNNASQVTSGFTLAISGKALGFRTSICNRFKNTNGPKAYVSESMEHGLYTDHVDYNTVYFDWGEPAHTTETKEAALTKFKNWLKAQYDAGEPVQLCYKLAKPVTVQLTPQEILALSGENYLFSNTGDTEVSGRADPIPIINSVLERLAALEAAVVNNI